MHKRFVLMRHEDETGVSGTGLVAHGILFPDGSAVTRWNTDTATIVIYDTIDDVLAIHGHGGKTEIAWVDD